MSRMRLLILVLVLVGFVGISTVFAAKRDYRFDGKISREVLENYLSRSNTMLGMLHNPKAFDENLRMVKNIGAKYLGRVIYRWGGEANLEELVRQAKPLAAKVHQADAEIILQAAVFEIVTRQVSQVTIPERIFQVFALPTEQRNFRYEDMLYQNENWVDHWYKGASVPDMSRLETRMWFVYAAGRYIDIGCEAIHFGQVEIMDDKDPDHKHWRDMMAKVRQYAKKYARRHLVLCDAHVPSGGFVHDGKLMFDLHSFPLRIEEVVEKPHQGILKMGYLDSIFGRSQGGITPSGWKCRHLPFIVELDNFEATGREGQNVGRHWIWGWDEINWFAAQTPEYRDCWLWYAWEWVRRHDPNGFLQMPGMRGKYQANTKSKACPNGFGQEETIKLIWAEDNAK